jgi:RNA-directed DNA polymerase
MKMADSLKGRRQLFYLWQQQGGICPICQQKITILTGWHSHHIVRRTEGGSDGPETRVLLHPNCHHKVHGLEIPVTKPRPAKGV